MIRNIQIKGYRGINFLACKDFKGINLFVGRNNVAKTTVLESLFLVTGSSNPRNFLMLGVSRRIALANISWNNFFYQLKTDDPIELVADVQIDQLQEKREIKIKANYESKLHRVDSVPKKEVAEQSDVGKTSASPKSNGVSIETVYTQGEASNKVTASIRDTPTSFETEVISETPNFEESMLSMFLTSKLQGVDICEIFDKVQRNKHTAQIVAILQKIEPSLTGLVLGSDDTIMCDVGLSQLVPIQVMGDGFARLLTVVLAIIEVENGIIFIDEIENGLYHSSMKILWDAVLEASRQFNVQIFATTHSYECVEALAESYKESIVGDGSHSDDIRLYRIEKKADKLKAVTYNHKTLSTSLESNWEVR